jgi:hypothetical protein
MMPPSTPAWIRPCNWCSSPLHVRKRTCDHCGAAQISRKALQEAARAASAEAEARGEEAAARGLAGLAGLEVGDVPARRASSAGVLAVVDRRHKGIAKSRKAARSHCSGDEQPEKDSGARLRRLLKLRALLVAAPAGPGLSESARRALAELQPAFAYATPLPSPTGSAAPFALLATVASLAAPESCCASPEP